MHFSHTKVSHKTRKKAGGGGLFKALTATLLLTATLAMPALAGAAITRNIKLISKDVSGVADSATAYSMGFSINASGQIVFLSTSNTLLPDNNPTDPIPHLYLYTPGKGVELITKTPDGAPATNPGVTASGVAAINDRGQIAFVSKAEDLVTPAINNSAGIDNIYLYTPKEGIRLVSADHTDPAKGGNAKSYPPKINSQGEIVFGSLANNLISAKGSATDRADLYRYTPGSGLEYIAEKIGDTFGNPYTAINDKGQIAFVAERDAIVPGIAGTRKTHDVFLYTPGSAIELITKNQVDADGIGGDGYSNYIVLNNKGAVAFRSTAKNLLTSNNPSNGQTQVFCYTPGSGMELISKNTGYYFADGARINDRGQVAFYSGNPNLDPNVVATAGAYHAYLYTPGLGIELISKDLNGATSPSPIVSMLTVPIQFNNKGELLLYSTARYLLAGSVPTTYTMQTYLYRPGSGIELISKNAAGTDIANAAVQPAAMNDSGQIVLASAATDLLAKNNPTAAFSAFLYEPKVTIPTTTIHTTGALTKDSTITFSAVSDDARQTTTYYTIDGGSTLTYDPKNPPKISEGVHTIRYWSEDDINIEDAKSITVTFDYSAPTLSITEPEEGKTYTGSPDIKIDCDDTDATITYELDGQAWAPGQRIAAGRHTLTVTATDAAGNTVTRTITFTVASPLPDTGNPAVTPPVSTPDSVKVAAVKTAPKAKAATKLPATADATALWATAVALLVATAATAITLRKKANRQQG